MTNRKMLGAHGESLAVEALFADGYTIVERNWRCAHGEIDIVARERETWVFVEVKTRSSDKFGTPSEAVTARKQERMINAAQAYLVEHGLTEVAWRIDVVAIVAPSRQPARMEIYKNAVEC